MLLPPSPFVSKGWKAVHHFEQAGIVSSDYTDLVPHGSRLYVMLGDVSGKGIAASMLMAQLHAMFRTLIPFQLSMDDLMTRASALLCASSLPAQYATLVFGYVASDGEVTISNAGHPPPLVIAGGHNTEVRATGVPIGAVVRVQVFVNSLDARQGRHAADIHRLTHRSAEWRRNRVRHIAPGSGCQQCCASLSGGAGANDDCRAGGVQRVESEHGRRHRPRYPPTVTISASGTLGTLDEA
jgi:hypothetical protein